MKKYRMPRKVKKAWKKKIDSVTTTTTSKTTERLTYKKLLETVLKLEGLRVEPLSIRYLPPIKIV